MPRIKSVVLLSLFCVTGLFAKNELQQSLFVPNSFAVNSSGLAADCSAMLVNPAGLSKLDRINFLVSSGEGLDVNFAGLAGTLPYIGTIGFSMYQFGTAAGNAKQGFMLGWGKSFLDSLAVGLSFKTAASSVFGLGQNILFDIGLIVNPNSSWGSFFAASWIANRLFVSAAFQNIGKHTLDDIDEEMNLRFGLAYNFKEIWTKLFFEKNLLSAADFFTLGFEFTPKPLPWITLRFAYDVN